MAQIPPRDAERLREHLDRVLGGPVTLDLYVRPTSAILIPGEAPCEFCDDTRALLEEVAALSDRLTLVVHDVRAERDLARERGIDVVPTLEMRGAEQGRVRFVGIPSGYEFQTLFLTLAAVSRGTTALRAETRVALQELRGPLRIQVFVTPTCPHCPGVAHLAQLMAVEHPQVTADVVEISEFPELAERYQVQGVPKIVINDTVEFVGAQPEVAFIAAIREANARLAPPAEAPVGARS